MEYAGGSCLYGWFFPITGGSLYLFGEGFGSNLRYRHLDARECLGACGSPCGWAFSGEYLSGAGVLNKSIIKQSKQNVTLWYECIHGYPAMRKKRFTNCLFLKSNIC